MRSTILFLLLTALTSTSSFAQDCNCNKNFEWVKQTFEKNDAGFAYILEKKGQQAYDDHNKRIAEQVNTARTTAQCAEILYEWMTFFRSGHISISVNENTNQSQEATSVKTPEKWESYKIKTEDFKKYLTGKKNTTLREYGLQEPVK